MGVIDGQSVSAGVTNPAFINKNQDDTMSNKLGFNRVGSGASIADIQQAINNIYAATGVSESQSGTTYNAPSGTITNGENYQTSLYRLAVKFAGTSGAGGHTHTGVDGDGAPLERTSIGFTDVDPTSILFIDATQHPNGAPSDLSWDYVNRFMGIRVSTPQTVLQVDGDLSLIASDIAAASDETALAIGSRSSYRVTGAGSTVRGISGGINGKFLILFNDMSADLILTNEDGLASAANRILTPTAGDMTVSPDQATLLQYQGAVSRWVVISGGGGSAGSGGGSLQWILDENSPIGNVLAGIQVLTFETGLNQIVYATIKVPESHVPGTQLFLYSSFFSDGTSGDVQFSADTYLVKPGTDEYDSILNLWSASSAAITLSGGTVNIPQSFLISLTDSNGQINSLDVNPGDILRVNLFRDSDSATADVNWVRDATEVTT